MIQPIRWIKYQINHQVTDKQYILLAQGTLIHQITKHDRKYEKPMLT